MKETVLDRWTGRGTKAVGHPYLIGILLFIVIVLAIVAFILSPLAALALVMLVAGLGVLWRLKTPVGIGLGFILIIGGVAIGVIAALGTLH